MLRIVFVNVLLVLRSIRNLLCVVVNIKSFFGMNYMKIKVVRSTIFLFLRSGLFRIKIRRILSYYISLKMLMKIVFL